MKRKQAAILLIEDNPGDARLIREMLPEGKGAVRSLEWVENLEAGRKRIARGGIDLVLLDLGLPESAGLETFRHLRADAGQSLVVVVMSGLEDEGIAAQAVLEGAQDYLIKGQVDGGLLNRSIRYAIERNVATSALRRAQDELERRVVERTAELSVANERLLGEVEVRRRAEEETRKSEAKYRNIFENAMEGIYQSTIEGRFITANAALARMAGYDSPEELIVSVKDIGIQLYVHLEDRKRFLEIRDAKGFVYGFEVEFYKKDGGKFWVVINARTVKDEQGRIIHFEGLIEDITIRKQTEKQLHQTLDKLKKAVDTTIQVLVSALEARDPYTAGHQSRVTHLARAIAKEMGLPKDKIDGIRMAGSIHDIGKLSIPAEILSKPAKLTEIEFALIKEHCRSGYEMLRDVESPWPLAEIIYQHHERMNGSGYPRNLKGNDILMEARILAVADVMEAMASHRPYRPTLGIEAALEEIEKNKGILYDNTVANVCLRLFREKGYQLTRDGEINPVEKT